MHKLGIHIPLFCKGPTSALGWNAVEQPEAWENKTRDSLAEKGLPESVDSTEDSTHSNAPLAIFRISMATLKCFQRVSNDENDAHVEKVSSMCPTKLDPCLRREKGKDMELETASNKPIGHHFLRRFQVFGKEESDITDAERTRAKVVCLGIIYGMLLLLMLLLLLLLLLLSCVVVVFCCC